MKLDLHGMTIHSAWNVFTTRTTDAYYKGHKTIVVVTGQGAIMREFPSWASTHPYVISCSNTQHNPGSFKISLKKG